MNEYKIDDFGILFKEMPYGFQYGSAIVRRAAGDPKRGWVIIKVYTPKHKESGLQIYVTKTGKIRVFSPNGIEMFERKTK